MFAEHYPEERLAIWPVGIDIDKWKPAQPFSAKPDRILIYDKVRWHHERYDALLIQPIKQYLRAQGLTVESLRYGAYFPEDLQSALTRCPAVVFLCEHETQGITYQQMLAAGVPLFAWDPGGYWPDPNYFPHRVRYEPVSSVPYWDERCGMKFESAEEFRSSFGAFWQQVGSDVFYPRAFVSETLTLEDCALLYADLAHDVVSRHNNFPA